MRIVIYGANDMGCLLAVNLFEDHDVTVIDKEENRLEDFDKLDISFVYGSGISPVSLEAAQIKDADVFVACTNNDEGNIISCYSVKRMSQAKTVCFVSKEDCLESLNILKGSAYHNEMYLDLVILPDELLTGEIFRIITVPKAIEVENFADGKARLTEYRIEEESKLLNKKLKDCHFTEQTIIVGITRDEKLFIPNGDTELLLNDKVIFMGQSKSLNLLASEFFKDKRKLKNVTIIGGGNVGQRLAQALESIGVKIKLFEKNKKRCEQLSEILQSTLILNADGTNYDLLKNEDIEQSDVVVAVTNNDEKNLLCSLLAKQFGVEKIITRVSKEANSYLFEKVGIDVAISQNEAAYNEIINSVIESDKGIITTVERGQGAITELRVPKSFKDTKVFELNFPKCAVISIIQRGAKVIIPKGDTLVRENDKLIVFTTQENAQKVKGFFN
ncbi:Trk system potassium transporter TrkA [bacterium]|nr:Trk system potassium transporter TrkA [bacterium]